MLAWAGRYWSFRMRQTSASWCSSPRMKWACARSLCVCVWPPSWKASSRSSCLPTAPQTTTSSTCGASGDGAFFHLPPITTFRKSLPHLGVLYWAGCLLGGRPSQHLPAVQAGPHYPAQVDRPLGARRGQTPWRPGGFAELCGTMSCRGAKSKPCIMDIRSPRKTSLTGPPLSTS